MPSRDVTRTLPAATLPVSDALVPDMLLVTLRLVSVPTEVTLGCAGVMSVLYRPLEATTLLHVVLPDTLRMVSVPTEMTLG